MKKFNSKLEISEKDKKLLLVLLAIGILVCAFYFGYQKLSAITDQYVQETSILKVKQKDLIEKNNNRQKYIDDSEMYKNTYNVIFSNYSNGTSQDASFDFLNKIEMITGTWIKSTTISDTSILYTFGNIKSSNPTSAGSAVYSTDMKGFKTTLTLTYEATYSQWKSLISFVNKYYSKNTIDSIAMSYNEVTGLVSGTMTLSTYAITGSQRMFKAPIFDLPTGTDNIFSSSVFNSKRIDLIDERGEYILSDYDYFVMLNASTADVDSCIIGKKDDSTKESIISSNSNASEPVSIKVTGTSGDYKIQYKIGDTTYPAKDYDKGVSFVPGNTIDLLMISSSRVSDKDKSSINLTLINETDITLNVKACNDDVENPRIKYESKTGSINIYK